MSWGLELWDKYEDLSNHANAGIEFLDKSVSEFNKERAIIEKKYAKNLRDLVKKYSPKNVGGAKSDTDNSHKKSSIVHGHHGPASIVLQNAVSADEEFTHMLAYKEVRRPIFHKDRLLQSEK